MSRLVVCRRLAIHIALGVSCACVFVRCKSDPPTLPPPTFVEQQLESLWIEPFYGAIRDSGMIVFIAQPLDTSFRLPPNARLRVRVTTSSGDSEDLGFWSYMCGQRDCSAISIRMESGHDVQELQSVIYTIPARFGPGTLSGRTGGVRLFDPRNMSGAIGLIASQKNVDIVEQTGIGVAIGVPFPYSQVLCAAPIDFTPPKLNDGTIQVRSGQTIQITYTQPDQSVLTATVAAP
jgi:hypothetical protein